MAAKIFEFVDFDICKPANRIVTTRHYCCVSLHGISLVLYVYFPRMFEDSRNNIRTQQRKDDGAKKQSYSTCKLQDDMISQRIFRFWHVKFSAPSAIELPGRSKCASMSLANCFFRGKSFRGDNGLSMISVDGQQQESNCDEFAENCRCSI